jgi:hypothetical protein
MYIKTLETNIRLKQQYKNLNGISDHTKSTDLIIDIIKRIKISGETVPLRMVFAHSPSMLQFLGLNTEIEIQIPIIE